MGDQLSPFKLLHSIAAKSRQLAAGLPAQEEIQEYWSGIAFHMAGRQYVAPIDQVNEILTIPSYTRLPGVQPWVFGVSNVRGRLVPIVDMATFFGERSQIPTRNRRIIVVDHDDMLNGIVVDSVEGMQHFPVDTYSNEVQPDLPESMAPFLQGHYTRGNRIWSVFSLHGLVTSQGFMQVAS